MRILIKNARIIDPDGLDGVRDVIVDGDRIRHVVRPGETVDTLNRKGFDQVIDAVGKILTPGLIDMHVHLREPGHEYKETILTGCRAAAAGGFTSICAMPNTDPVNDGAQIAAFIKRTAENAGLSRVFPVGAITKGLGGTTLCEYQELKAAGVIALTDDGKPVSNGLLMRRAMEYAAGFGLFIISHCEDLELAMDGVMNEGALATRMGLRGIPNAAESVMVMRDISLCELTDTRLHIAHVSTAESVRAVREAKKRGVKVTAETAPHYFTLTEDAVIGYNTNAKMNPPLRSERDREAIREGLADGTIDVIATDHAPHSILEKDLEFDLAANGIIGLETAVSLGLKLVEDNIIDLTELIRKMTTNPGRILGVGNRIEPDAVADLTIIDTEKPYIVDANSFKSKSRNTPFDGWRLKGKAVLTMVGGRIIYNDLQEPVEDIR